MGAAVTLMQAGPSKKGPAKPAGKLANAVDKRAAHGMKVNRVTPAKNK